jgi:hypothetical protein
MDLGSWAQATGGRYASLAFFNSAGGCAGGWPNWNEGAVLAQAKALQALGGQVIISSGGWNANDIVRNCTDPNQIAQTYDGVLDRFGTDRLDLDPEHGDSQNNLDATLVDRRNQALKILQDRRSAAGKKLVISYTIGVSADQGLTQENLYVLQSAKRFGVDVALVNPMIMNFYDGVSGRQMGARSIQALQRVHAQIKQVWPGKTDAQYWSMLAATAMIGQNDSPTEIFTVNDANQLRDFARQQGMSMLSFWSLGRDNGSCPGNTTANWQCSGVSQGTWDYSRVFNSF